MSLIRLNRRHLERHNPALLEALAAHGIWRGKMLEVGRAVYFEKIGGMPSPKPRPWPTWALALAALANPGDVGLGDVAAREIGPFKSDAFKLWYAEAAGVGAAPCQCSMRSWNRRYPLTLAR